MNITREFIGWDRHVLHEAARRLLSLSGGNDTFDLQHVCAVLPGARAGRRLLEVLLEQSEQAGHALIPPRIITAGQIPEQLYESDAPVLGNAQRLVLWMEALREEGAENLKKVIPRPPAPDDFVSWIGLARKVDEVYVELSAENLGFSDVAQKCRNLPGFADEERWEVLHAVFLRYLQECRSCGAVDLYEARRQALAGGSLTSVSSLYLVACSDLNRMTRLMLEASNTRAVAFVAAPSEKEELFDTFGCICVDRWKAERIEIADAQIEILQNPSQEADSAVKTLIAWQGRFSMEEISFGVGDPALGPLLLQRLEALGVPAREASGVALKVSSLGRFLEAVLGCVRSGHFFDYATLLRHPAVLDWLEQKLSAQGFKDLLPSIDRYQDEHLQELLTEELPGDSEAAHCARTAMDLLRGLLSRLADEKHDLSSWARIVSDLLVEVFGGRPLRRFDAGESRIIRSVECIQEELLSLSDAGSLYPAELNGVEMLTFLLSQLFEKSIPYEGTAQEALEILGWLELALDDAEGMLVLGVAEGLVPQTLNSDAFLPDSLRRAAGLLDNDRRLARDAFSLTLISRVRSELKIFCSRTDARGEPRFPSRLLFACDDGKLAGRVKSFQAQAEKPAVLIAFPLKPEEKKGKLHSLRPVPGEPPSRMSVTGFRDYIECPYRYYLRHVLKLDAVNDRKPEMDGRSFGNIAHAVLCAFAGTAEAGSSDPRLVCAALKAMLAERSRLSFGSNPLAAVTVQLKQLEARLERFAVWQAGWAAQGWKIRFSEFSPREISLQFSGGSMLLCGRIDRVDYNTRTGEWAVFDYKTSDRFETPEKVHRHKQGWVNLQLPAYLYMLRESEVCESARLGYITLCSEAERIGAAEAQWSSDELAGAVAIMHEVAQSVHNQIFWPPKILPADWDEYGAVYRALKFSEQGGGNG